MKLVLTKIQLLGSYCGGVRPVLSLMFACLLLLIVQPAAALVTVGPSGSGCSFTKVQDAIDHVLAKEKANDYSDPNIGVVAFTDYNEAVIISDQDIAGGVLIGITGGLTDTRSAGPCDLADQGVGQSSIQAGGSQRGHSVVEISGNSSVYLKNLILRDAVTSGAGDGGGIDFHGTGLLDLTVVTVTNNVAITGAGIFVNGNSPGVTFNIHHGTSVNGNTASHDGGGVHIEGETHLFMDEPNVSIYDNVAGGKGGGLDVSGSQAKADVGSPGFDANFVTIHHNTATDGGGVSVENRGTMRLFTTVFGAPASINLNAANNRGGGVFLDAGDNIGEGTLCAFGYSISGNTAADGAAIYSATSGSNDLAGVAFLTDHELADQGKCGFGSLSNQGQVGCPVGQACNSIDGNTATNADGAVVVDGGHMDIEQAELRQNTAANVLRSSGPVSIANFVNCLIADNLLTKEVILSDDSVALDGCTVAGNSIGGLGNVITSAGNFSILRSIVWQPGIQTLDERVGGKNVIVADSIVPDANTFSGAMNVHSFDPQFRAPSAGNYRLTANSQAVDYATTGTAKSNGALIDLDNQDRGVDNRSGGNRFDIGAYEFQSVLIPTFPNDENFEELDAPTLPLGWVSPHSGAGNGWRTTTIQPDNGRIAAFAEDPDAASDSSLITNAFTVAQWGQLRYRHQVSLEASFDAAVLEISINGSAFTDIVSAGGSFVKGRYNTKILETGHALVGRNVWSGDSGGYADVVIDLPAEANGQSVRLSWRLVSDRSNGGAGYWIDDIHVDTNLPIRDEIFRDNLEEFPNN